MHGRFLKQHSLINMALCAIFLIWNCFAPFVADDYLKSALDVRGHSTLFLTLYHSYYTWTGRLSAEILANFLLSQSYLNYTIILINIINSLVLIAILNLLYKLACGGTNYTNHKFSVFSISYLTYFILIGTFAQDFLWKTVAIQYAWGALILLIVIWRFYLNLNFKQNSPHWTLAIYAVAGIFIGFYNEIYIAFVTNLYLTTFIVWLLYKKSLRHLLKSQYIVFLLSVLIAGIISIMAPGNFLRQQTYLLNEHIPHYGILAKFSMTYVQFFRYGYHIAFSIILLWIGIWTYKYRKNLPTNLTLCLTFLLILLNIHILSFVGIAYYSPISGRMLLIMDSIIFLIFFKFFQYKLRHINFWQYRYFFYSFTLILMAYVSTAYYQLYKFNLMRRQMLIHPIAKDVIVPKYCTNAALKYAVYFDDIKEDKYNFRNVAIAAYYKLNSVVIGGCQ